MSSVWLVAMMSLSAITTLEPAGGHRPAPPTILVNSSGKLFDLTSLKGKVVIVSFVYTTCNGTCPATTLTLSRVQKALQQAKLWGISVEFVSISLDPERDTPDVLKRYAELFNADLANWNFLTGSRSDVQSVIATWGMWAQDRSCPVCSTIRRGFSCSTRKVTSGRSIISSSSRPKP